jgi:hypothetical protein
MTEPPRQKTPPDGPEQPASAGAEPPPWWDEFERAHERAGLGGNGANGGAGFPPPRSGLPDLTPLFALVDALRRMVPAELQEQWVTFQRELLLLVRAMIDWYLERLDAGPHAPEVEDIPIE